MYKKALNRRHFFYSTIVVALLSISACATTGDQKSADSDLDLAKYATLTTHDAVNSIASSYQTSDINELAIYAPSHYSTAGKAIEDAKALLAQSQPREQIVEKVAVAEAVLRNGDRVMRKVKDILEDEITIKEKLDSLNTKSVYKNEYGSLDERLNKLILKIENGNNTDDQNREKLLKDMQVLERKAIHYSAMNEPQEILKRVKYRGGEQLAPITYAEALAVFKRAEEFIQQNPNYEVGITQIGREALFAAKRALYITEGVSALKQKVTFAPEQVILDEEYRMYRVARHLAELDYRDNSLEVQSELLAKEAESLSLELKNKDDLVIALRDTLIKVRDSSSRLTMLSESTGQLKKEKNEWLAKEALFTAKVSQLHEQLQKTEAQLDFTQQTLLALKADNTRLAQQIHSEEQNAVALESKPAETNSTAQDVASTQNEETTNAVEPVTEVIAVETPMPAIANIETEPTVITDTVEAIPAPAPAELVSTSEEKQEPILATENNPVTDIVALPDPQHEEQIEEKIAAQAEAESEINSEIKTETAAAEIAVETNKNNPLVANNPPENIAINTEEKAQESLEPAISSKAPVTTSDETPALASVKSRPKITEQETLEALESARELIESLRETENKLEVKVVDNEKPETKAVYTNPFFNNEDSDSFVDAGD